MEQKQGFVNSMTWVAGVDGCRAGWVVVLTCLSSGEKQYRIISSLQDILDLPEQPVVIGIDMPIGLLDAAEPGGRSCDREARVLLGQPRARSVFSPPVRSALSADTYEDACTINRASSPRRIAISKQCFGLFPKLRELDDTVTPSIQRRIKEVHPEVSFYTMNDNQPMQLSKHRKHGLLDRHCLLVQAGFGPLINQAFKGLRAIQAKKDDFLDACVACWTAGRIHEGQAVRIPKQPAKDAKGLYMEIWG